VAFWRATRHRVRTPVDRGEFVGRNRNSERAGRALPRAARRAHRSRARPCGALQLVARDRTWRIAQRGVRPRTGARPVSRDRAGRSVCLDGAGARTLAAVERMWDRHSAPCRSAHPTIRSISSSIAGCSTDIGLSRMGAQRPVSARRRLRFPRSAPGRARADVRAADLCRAHLLHAASRQFVEGDVQHWWHPPSGRGTRTRCSDDLLWLPYAVASYVSQSGDESVLDEVVAFLEGRRSNPISRRRTSLPRTSSRAASAVEHSRARHRARDEIRRSRLPLIGSETGTTA
jgi:cyclic beta-1,2-glucan synthetase